MDHAAAEYTPIELTEKEELESLYCEMHKDVYGVKARWYRAETVEQARADIERLGESLKAVMEQERAGQAAAVAKFESRVTELMACGAGDRATAVRWIHQAEDSDGTDEHLCWQLGLPFGYKVAVGA